MNELIDSLCHPLTKVGKGFILVDGILHGLVEQNPPASGSKFLRFSFPLFIKQLESARNRHSYIIQKMSRIEIRNPSDAAKSWGSER